MTPELKAYLDESRAEHKIMYDEMLDTLRRPLTELSCHPKIHYLKLDFFGMSRLQNRSASSLQFLLFYWQIISMESTLID
jgi:hypothetical protein